MKRAIVVLASCIALLTLLSAPAVANPFDEPLVIAQTIDFPGANSPGSAVVDPVNGLLYCGSDDVPGQIAIFRLATRTQPAALLHVITLDTGENFSDTILPDPHRNALYVALFTAPGRIIKFRTGAPDELPTRLGHLDLETDEDSILGAAFDQTANTGYFALATNPSRVVKIDLGDGDALPTRVGAVTLEVGENNTRGMGAISPARGKLWVVTSTDPGIVVQISLGAPGAPPTRDLAVNLPFRGCSTIVGFDPLNESLFVPTTEDPGILTKVGLAGPEPTIIGNAFFENPNRSSGSAAVSPLTGVVYVAGRNTPVTVTRTSTGGKLAGPGFVDTLTLPDTADAFNSGAYDAINGFHYVLTTSQSSPGNGPLFVLRQEFAAGPDLTGTISNLKVSGKPGKFRAKARLTETNIGTADAPFHLVRFFLSDDAVLDASDTQLGADRIVKSLKSGKSRRLSINSPPLAASPSGKFIFAHIDRNNLSGDVNPGNNVIVSAPLP